MCHKDTARSPRISDLEWICLPDTVETETGDGGGDALNTPLVQPIDDVATTIKEYRWACYFTVVLDLCYMLPVSIVLGLSRSCSVNGGGNKLFPFADSQLPG